MNQFYKMNSSIDFFPGYLVNEYYTNQANFMNNLKPIFIKTFLTSKCFKIGGDEIFEKIVNGENLEECQEILNLYFRKIKNEKLARFLVKNNNNIEDLIRKSLESKNIHMFKISCGKIKRVSEMIKYLFNPYQSGENLFNSLTFKFFMSRYSLKTFKSLITEKPKDTEILKEQRNTILKFLKKFHIFIDKNSNIIPLFLTLGFEKGMAYFEYFFDITYFLIRYGFNINAKFNGFSAIELCYKNNFYDLVDYLIFKGARISDGIIPALEILDMKSYHDFLKSFSDCKIRRNIGFHKFVDGKHRYVAEIFLNSFKIYSYFNEILLDLDVKDLDFFMNNGNKSKDYRFDLPGMLFRSIKAEREDLVDFLISKGVEIKNLHLRRAFYNKNNNILQKLLSSGKLDLVYGAKYKNVFEKVLSKIDKEKFLLFIQYGAKISLDEIREDIEPPFIFLLQGTLGYKSEDRFEDFKEMARYFPISDIQKACDIFFLEPPKFFSRTKREFRAKIIEFLKSLGVNFSQN